jgi:hypothetical protein
MEKTKYTKFVDENGVFFYTLELPDGTKVEKVCEPLALYLHQLEQKLKANE